MACGLEVEVLYTAAPRDAPPAAVPVLVRVRGDTPDAAVRTKVPHRDGGHWLRLRCTRPTATDGGWVLAIDGPASLGPLTLHLAGAAPRTLAAVDRDGPSRRGSGWRLALPHGWPAASVAYLHAAGTGIEPIALRVVPARVLAAEARADGGRAQAAAAVLVVLALAMLVIHLRHRDLLYLSYAGYCVCTGCYLVVLASVDGSVLDGFAAHGATGRWALVAIAIALKLVFTRRVLELDRLAPGAARLVRGLFATQLTLLAMLLVGRTHVHGWYPTLANTFVLAAAPLLLAVAVLARHRGAAYAGYYLAGWTPLIAAAAVLGADRLGLVAAPWAQSLLAPAAVAESLVLAFALSRQAVHRRYIRRRLHRSNERDALTGAPNTAALMRLLDGWRDLGALGARGFALILIELDAFDAFAARHGLPVADAALCQAHARCRVLLHENDTLARVGTARFAIVHEGDLAAAERLARDLVDALAARPFAIDDALHGLRASAGIAVAGRGEAPGLLMQRARLALRSTSDHGPPPAPEPAFAAWMRRERVHPMYGKATGAFTADA